jgi:EmrB/QacA subfamily drug resistance transporter
MSLLPSPATYDVLSERHGAAYKWIVLAVIALGTVAGVLSTSSFNVAVPAMTRHFGIGQEQVQWAMTGFMAAMAIGMLPTSWLLDRLGLRRVFLAAQLTLMAASIFGFFAPSFALVVLARVVQGLAAGVLQPIAMLALLRLFPREIQGRASGLLTFSIALTPAIAPALGGLLLERFGWEAIFLLGLPFGLLAGGAALYLLPLPRELASRRFDWAGLGWLSLATVALVEGVASLQHSGLLSPWTLGQFGLALAAVLLFWRHARRLDAPLIQLKLFGDRTFAMGSLVSFSYGFGLYASTYLVPVFLQNVLSYQAAAAGLALLPSGIALVLTLPLAGRLVDRYPPKRVTLAGLLAFGASFVVFALEAGRISYAEIIAATVVGRIGLGLILPALNLAALRHVGVSQLGQAAVVSSYARQLGGVVGIAVVAVFVQWRESVHGTSAAGLQTAYSQGFLLLAAVFLLAVVAAARMQADRAPAPLRND